MRSIERMPDRNFYLDGDVVGISKRLLGMKIVSNTPEGICAGIITETEAYAGETDRASHAFGGRLTQRTEVMYREGGIAYVYLCYGLHSLLNVVTGPAGLPHAVLIRGIYPLEGIDIMAGRIKRSINLRKDGLGPGKLTRLLGVDISYNGTELKCQGRLWIEYTGLPISESMISSGPRIGIDYAGEDAGLPYRFLADVIQVEREIKKAGLV
ncbi:DNA-3-methyladenine glycosylase [Lentimicrobium sp.]|nr:DNA-3-methyladenine glycosylase [Lentimicrobium sp.]HPF65389.1 DNA-3-methyladenine glycosylase [Lentimicrobium sp.]HRW69903.1 DNA-3-methyladenine glycosylase [Lentimicrobium sp.]